MNWYDLLITKEFLDYFSNDDNIFYTVDNDKQKYNLQPLFKKFADTVFGITYAFIRWSYSFEAVVLLSMKEMKPDIYNAYINCQKLMPPIITLADIWQSIKVEEKYSPYQVDIKSLNAEQIAVLILYPFWNRMGGSWEIAFLDDGRLKKYLLELKQKSEQ